MSPKAFIRNLGCPKNEVDGGIMAAYLQKAGCRLVASPANADFMIVNTCGFVREAKEESIHEIFELVRHKETGRPKVLIVAGCLAQRYKEELSAGIPEIDHFLGISDLKIESMWASRAFGRKPEMEILTPLAKLIPFFVGAYMVAKISDLVIRDAYVYLLDGSFQSMMFILEFGFGVMLPFFLLLSERVRRSPTGLFICAALYVILGVLLNRINVFVVAYKPLYAEGPYVPSMGEIAVTAAMISALILCYRVIVSILPVLPAPEGEEGSHAAKA